MRLKKRDKIKEMKIKINSKITAILLTITIILVIFFAGPANAVILSLDISKVEVTRGSTINLMPKIQIESNELVNIDSIELKLYKSSDIIECKFYPNATIIIGCEGMKINLLEANDQSNFGYGYGYLYKSQSDYGYGYGYQPGFLMYNITLNTNKFDLGKYRTELIINVEDTKFNINGQDITILSKNSPKLNNRCSIRAFDGTFNIDSKEFSNNRIKFYITKKESVDGKGSLSGQKGRERFTYKFDIDKIIENNESNLTVAVYGRYRIGRNGIAKNIPENATLNFDRVNNRVSIIGDKINIKTMMVSFIEGCEFL